MKNAQEIIELVNVAHGNAVAKGWWEEERTLSELVALIHSEASEALEDFRAGKQPNDVWYEYKCEDGSVELDTVAVRYGDSDEVVLGKPCGIPSELADIVIRVFDLVGKLKQAEPFADVLHDRIIRNIHSPMRKNLTFGDNMGWLHVVISRIITGGREYFDAARVVQAVYELAEYNGIHLDVMITEKMAYNTRREYRHGGKVL